MKRLVISLLLVIGALVATVVLLGSSLKDKKGQVKALENNQLSLLQENKTFRTENGKLTTKTINLSLKKDELKYLNDSINDELKDSKVKIGNLTKYIDLHISSSQETKPIVKDSLVYLNDSALIKGKVLSYDNYWYRYKGIIYNDSANLKISCNHDVRVYDEMIYKGWWIFRKLKRIETTVVVSNPNDTITRLFSVDVVNKKRKKQYE